MKKPILITLISTLILLQAKAQGPEIASWVRNTTGAVGYNNIPSNVQTVQYSTNNVYVSCTGIPGYSIGPWGGNPNTPVSQNFVFKITRNPQVNTGTASVVGLGHIGVWTNGVTIFNVQDAMTYNNQGVWYRNAYFFEGPGFDNCLGHPQQQGEYHHHVSPTCLYNQADSLNHSPIIGYAFDGFPIYGAYAYTNTNGTGAIKRMTPSYRTRNITTRTTLPNGSAASFAGPAINTQYPLGAFIQDFEYVAGSGDLDDRNGRFCITPEYPAGTYAYFVTIDATQTPVFPYTFYGTFYGVVQAGNMGMNSGHNTISEPTTVYTGPTGVNENTEIKFEIVPNPTSDYVYLYMDANSANNLKGSIYDTKGRLLETKDFLQPSIAYTFDMAKYPSGVYFLHLENDKQKVVKKIIKTKN